MDLARALRDCGLFRGFDDARLAALAAGADAVDAATGADVVREGDAGDAMYVVLAGAVQVYTRDRDGGEVVLARIEPGGHFGEQSLLPGATGRRNASVRGAGPARLARVSKAAFQAALAEDDALRERLLALGVDQIRYDLQALSPLARGVGLESVPAWRRALADGEVLFHQGDDADGLYFVSAGRLVVWREDDGRRTLIRYVARGGCVGELALVRRDRRSATVAADGPAEVLAVPRAAFDEVYGRSEVVRQHLATLERVYELPRRGLVTQHAGSFAGHDCVTTLYHLTGGQVVAAYRVVGQDLYAVERLGGEAVDTLVWRDGERSRELRLAADGTVLGVTARGAFADAHMLHLFVLDGGRLGAAERTRFATAGTLDVGAAGEAADMVCHCVNVSADTLRRAIADGAVSFDRLQKTTGCGTVCGGCTPVVSEMLGAQEWVVADVVSQDDEAPGVRSFDLAPRDARYPDAEPGQHIVVEGLVRGLRLRRPYTLSSARRHGGRLRITVKREPRGAFSRWLFDERPAGEPVRITRPRGDSVIDVSGPPVVCLAAGIGITPALAAARTIVDEGHATRLVVHYSVRTRDAMSGGAELAGAATRANVELVVRETAREGRLDAATVADLVGRAKDARWYLCGPPGYLDTAGRLLRAAGVGDERIHVEAFTPVGTPVTGTAEHEAVRRYVLVPPQRPPTRRLARSLKRLGAAAVAVANSPLTDWRVGGPQLNPLRALEAWLARAGRLDPAVPHEQLAIVSALSWGAYQYQLRGFERLERLAAQNRARAAHARAAGSPLPPDTPDGDTFAYVMPSAPFPAFPPSCAVRTGWTRPGPGYLGATYVTRSPSALEHLLRRTDDSDRGALPYHFLQQVIGRTDMEACPGRKPGGLIGGQFHDNATWSEDRALMTEMFGFPAIDAFGPGMRTALDATCAAIDEAVARDPDMVIDLNVLLSRVAYTIIIRAIFGDVDLAEMHVLGRAVSTSLRRLFQYVWEYVMGRQSLPADYVALQQAVRGGVRAMIELLRDLDRRGQLGEAQRALPPVRLILERAGQEDDRLFALLLPLVIAGHETTGHTMSWALYHLSRQPDVEAALLREVATFRAAHGGALSTADYDERPLSWALLAETLRLYSPFQSLPRTTLRDGVVPADPRTGIGGFRYPANTMMVFSVVGIHLDPKRWPEPETFRLDRWLHGVRDGDGAAEQGRRVRANIREREQAFDWLPFSDGPGRCPGQYFNVHEFFLVLDALLPRYRFEPVDPDREVRPGDAMVVGPEPGAMAVRVRRRAARG